MRFSRPMGVALALSTVGCHAYHPVGLDELHPGMEIRASVSASQAEELSQYLPTEHDRRIEGTVLDASPAQLLLLVPVTTRNVPGQRETLGQRLEIPADGIFEVEQKDLDRPKTGMLTAAVALLTGYVLYSTLREGSTGSTPGDGPPGPQDSTIPFRIPVFGR